MCELFIIEQHASHFPLLVDAMLFYLQIQFQSSMIIRQAPIRCQPSHHTYHLDLLRRNSSPSLYSAEENCGWFGKFPQRMRRIFLYCSSAVLSVLSVQCVGIFVWWREVRGVAWEII